MKWQKFRLPLAPFKIKLIPTQAELLEAFDFGKEVAEISMGKMIEMDL